MPLFPQKSLKVLDCDFSCLDGTCCYCSPESAALIRRWTAGMELHAVHLIGTGDYHYQTLFWLERMRSPFSLVLLDNHPDDQEGAFGEELLSCGGWVARARRLPLLEKLLWIRTEEDAAGADLGPLPGKLYLSVDMDVLSEDYARTDWDQGNMSLESLCRTVRDISSSGRLAGADICGGITAEKGGTQADFDLNARSTDAILEALGASR